MTINEEISVISKDGKVIYKRISEYDELTGKRKVVKEVKNG